MKEKKIIKEVINQVYPSHLAKQLVLHVQEVIPMIPIV